MPTATVNTTGNGKSKTIYMVVGVILLAVVSAFLFIFLNQSQDSQNKAASPTLNTGGTNTGSTATIPTAMPTKPAAGIPQTGGLNRSCEPEGATCKWEVLQSAPSNTTTSTTTFNYEIRDTTTGQVVKSGNTTSLSVTFTPLSGHAYSCTVTPINSCSQGAPVTAKQSCLPSITPTETPSSTPTPTKAISITPNPTSTPAITPSVTPTGTQSPSGTPTKTPTPTEIIIVSATNTPPPSATAKPGSGTTATPVPPAAGVVGPTLAILVFASIIILLGLAF